MIRNTIDKIQKLKDADTLKKYIDYIRFPYNKILE